MKNELKAKMVVAKRLQAEAIDNNELDLHIDLSGVVDDHRAHVFKDGKQYMACVWLTGDPEYVPIRGWGDLPFDAIMDAIRQVHLNDDIDLDKCGFYSFNKDAV